MSRYQPPPRDRSPPRHPERRPSAPYATLPATSSYRASNDPNQIPIDRPPPRGPKAESFRGSFQYGATSRGRGGFAGRPETWDRERERDMRDSRPVPSSFRRDDDRSDWRSRDRDLYPAERGAIAGRDTRPHIARDRSASPTRARRSSKEDLYPAFPRTAEASPWASTRGGAPRGRGRDWERGRGRPLFGTDRERELFPPRSRSGDTRRERDRDRESDWLDTNDRRDVDRSQERETRSRESESWSLRDRPPSRQSSDTAGKSISTPTTATNADVSDALFGSSEWAGQQEVVRRPSMGLAPANAPRDFFRGGVSASANEPKHEPGSRDVPLTRVFSPTANTQTVTASLDYGPPPAPAVVGEKPPSSKPTHRPTEPSAAGQTSFQPPTGPKAERSTIGPPPTAVTLKVTAPESWAKSEPRPRSLLAAPAHSPTAAAPHAPKVADSTKENRFSMPAAGDRALHSHTPAGPRSGVVGSTKPRAFPKEPFFTSSPPTAPKGDQTKGIPTGPRALVQDTRPPPPRGPSTLAPLGSMRSHSGDHRDRSVVAAISSARPDTISRQPPTGPRAPPSIFNRPSAAQNHDDARRLQPGSTATFNEDQRHLEEQEKEDLDMSGTASSDDEIEDEDALDEADFLVSEEKHRKEVKVLESKKPLPLLKDPVMVALLLRVQMLGMIIEDAVPAAFQGQAAPVIDEAMEDFHPTGLLSPQHGSDEEVKPQSRSIPIGRPLKESPINPIPTPPIDELPFRTKTEPQFLIFEDSDDEIERESTAVLIQQEFEKKAFQWRDEVDVLRNSYRENYLAWRVTTMELDFKKELRASTPAPASPAPSAAPPMTPLLQERTRGAKNATELDFEAVLRMSEQSAREEEERREREKSRPNPDSEADIPAMLQPSEVEMCKFKDTNHLIPDELAIDIFALIPPVDDFTEEEQKVFIAAYIQQPKKFGRIAERLPERTYQQCIMHYYLTKVEAQYKECSRRAAPKRGRRKLPTQNRANALLTDSIYQDEADPLPVTDSGRPRRAAAPTFGDPVAEPDNLVPNQATKRALDVKESNGEPLVKATRGRKAGMGTKTRRTKAQIQEDARLAQQQAANGLEPSPRKGRPPARPDKSAVLGSGVLGTATPLQQVENVRTLDGEVGPVQHAPVDFISTQTMTDSELSSTPQIGSYWSVPEQQKFPELVGYFGRDWPAIANFMKTKSVVMIKNFYQRQLDGGKRDLEQSAMLAEDRRGRGEPIGPPPTPIAPQKRRYESTPSLAAAPRNIASAVDGVHGDLLPSKMPHTLIDEFDPNSVQRGVRGELIAKPRDATNPPSLLPQQRVDEPHASTDRPNLQQSQLPRNGYSRDERHDGFTSQFSLPGQESYLHHHPPARAIDLAREEQPQETPPQMVHSQAAVRDIPSQQHQSSLQQLRADSGRASQAHTIGHARTNSSLSSITPTLSLFEKTTEPPFGRQEQSHRGFYFGTGAAQSPTLAPQGSILQQRVDLNRSNSTPVEPQKQVPAKRSNITDLLNAPSEPMPEERHPSETARVPSATSPPASLVRHHQILDRGREAAQLEHVGAFTQQRGSLDQQRQSLHLTPQSSAGGDYGSQSLAQMQRDPWLNRFDPRPPSSAPDRQPAASASQPQSHYSAAPPPSLPANNPVPLQRLQQMDSTGRSDTSRVTTVDMPHRRSILGQLDFPRLAPSPPPQQQSQQVSHGQYSLGPPHRSASGSSQHGRVGSVGYGTVPHQQQAQSQSQTQAHSHSHSVSSTPATTPHSHHQARSQGSGSYTSRFGLAQGAGGIQILQQQMVDREREVREELERRQEREVQQSVLKAQQEAIRARDREREFAEQRAREQAQAQADRDHAASRSRGMTGLLYPPLGHTSLHNAAQAERERQRDIELQRERDRRDMELRRQQDPLQHGLEARSTEQGAQHEFPKRYEYQGIGLGTGPLSRRADSMGGRDREREQEIQRQRDAAREREMAHERELAGSRMRAVESAPRTFTPPSGHGGSGFSLGLGFGGPFSRAPAPLTDRDTSLVPRSGPRPLPPMRGSGVSTDGPGLGPSHFRSMSHSGSGSEDKR